MIKNVNQQNKHCNTLPRQQEFINFFLLQTNALQ